MMESRSYALNALTKATMAAACAVSPRTSRKKYGYRVALASKGLVELSEMRGTGGTAAP